MAKKGSLPDMQSVTSTISTMLVLLLLGLVVLFVMTAGNLSRYVRENIAFTIIVGDKVKEADILTFQSQLNERAYIRQTNYISKEQALKEQTEAMGADPSEFLGYNPFSPSIEVKLAAEYANSDSLEWIKDEIMADKRVSEIDYPQELLNSVNSNIRKISFFLLLLAALLTMISFALINNTVRLTIYSKRFLIHTMTLVGASWGFIRRPFIARNAWIGLVAAVMANALLLAAVAALIYHEPDLLQVLTLEVAASMVIVVTVCGILITTFCAYISLNKFLRMRVTDMYYK